MTIRYIPYLPEPVTGQALLSNFNRVLKYKGSNDLEPRIIRGMPLYEAELVETVGKPDSRNMVFRGDCISTCAYLRDKGIKVDLVYIDPPFASGADYAKKVYLRKNPKIAEAIEKAESELDLEDFKQFEEKMYGDIWDKEKYLGWMYENLLAIRSVMSEKACLYVHLDWHIGHYVKILLDEVFGEDNFINEVIWHYSGAGTPKGCWAKRHDTIFLYGMSQEWVFNADEVRTEYSESTKERFSHKINNVRNGIDFGEQSLNPLGKYPEDVLEVSIEAPSSNARVGYATQKPIALLEKLIKGLYDVLSGPA
ncbi:DNA methyltransferase [Methanomethylophilus alvi]|uniref:DNA methyltransferase n=1 Tax=Methanomethylophilus alvi TaxID=1291540 RepID=UPI0037DC1F65